MQKKTLFVLIGVMLPFFILLFFTTFKTSEEVAMICNIREKILSHKDQAKLKMIDASVAIYTVEMGYSPASLDDLVEQQYLSAQDIVDHEGQKFAYTSKNFLSDSYSGSGMYTTTTSKSCGKCGKGISISSEIGDRCPHCGVKWGFERVRQSY